MKLSIIIPAYNESRTIKELIRSVTSVQYPCDYEVIIIDDCSIDRSYEELIIHLKSEKGQIKLFRNRTNMGKGASLRQGFKHATGDIVIVQDADTEYDPHEIPKVIAPILKGEADVVFGSRFLGKWHPDGMAFPNWVANRILTKLTNFVYGSRLTDMETCYKAIKAPLIKGLRLHCNRFNFEPEITALLLKKKINIKEVPIRYKGRTAKEGKKIKTKDFFQAVWTLVKCRVSKDLQ